MNQQTTDMKQNKLSMEETVRLAEDMFANPSKYGLTEEIIHQWSLDNINAAAEILPKVPEHLRDELSDGIIDAYMEKKKRELQGSKDKSTPADSHV